MGIYDRKLFHLKENQLINVINYIWVFPLLKYQLSTEADGPLGLCSFEDLIIFLINCLIMIR